MSAGVSVLDERGMPAAAALQPAGLRQVAPAFAAVTLQWLHDTGERSLLAADFGMWAVGLLVPGTPWSYGAFADVGFCLLPCPTPPSLAGSGFLAASGRPCPVHASSCG